VALQGKSSAGKLPAGLILQPKAFRFGLINRGFAVKQAFPTLNLAAQLFCRLAAGQKNTNTY
jgi:hypothetical protein